MKRKDVLERYKWKEKQQQSFYDSHQSMKFLHVSSQCDRPHQQRKYDLLLLVLQWTTLIKTDSVDDIRSG